MRRGGDEGQAATELALVLPLVALVVLAVVQVTLVARDQILVVHAAREAARQGSVDTDPEGARAAAVRAGGLDPARLEVTSTLDGGGGRGAAALVVVEVRYRSPTVVPLVGPLLPDLALRAKAAMRVESQSVRDISWPQEGNRPRLRKESRH